MCFIINFPTNQHVINTTHRILLKSKPLNFHKKLKNYKSTDLHNLRGLASKLNLSAIHVKDESNRFGLGSFKPLGASYAVHKIHEIINSKETFCTATDGNHGVGLSWISQVFNKKCVVYVPRHTTKSRIKYITNLGSKVIKLEKNYDQTCEHALKTSKKMGWQLVQDVSFKGYEKIPAYIMSGYQTHMHEIDKQINCEELPFYDVVFLQCGVGSWAASCIWYYLEKYGLKRPKIILVEPRESAGVYESFQSKKRTDPKGSLKTIAQSLNCGKPSFSAWDIIQSGCDGCIKVDDADIIAAKNIYLNSLANDPKIFSGNSGAVGLAGLLKCFNHKKSGNMKKHIGLGSNSKVLLFNTEGTLFDDL